MARAKRAVRLAAPVVLSGRAMVGVRIRKSALPFAVAFVVCIVVLEGTARLVRPAKESPWRFGPGFGYEPKPTSSSRDGFRSPDVPIRKPSGVRRIIALGDSVAFSASVPYEQSWPYLLERRLNQQDRPVQVLSAGVPGYVSAQVVYRYLNRGAKYQPDLVILLVGWNDMGYSSLPQWHPNINLSELKVAWLTEPTAYLLGSRLLGLSWSRLNPPVTTFPETAPAEPLARRDSHLPFNDAALRAYIANLETLRARVNQGGARLAIVVWPTLMKLGPPDASIGRKAATTFAYYPLSWREFEDWYDHYVSAILAFARAHSEVLLVDPTDTFGRRFEADAQFTDICHLTAYGEATLAECIWSAILEGL